MKRSYSNSSIKTYQQCPFKYKLTRIDKLSEPTGEAAERGKNIHKEFEDALKGMLFSDAYEYWIEYITSLIQNKVQSEVPFGITKDWKACDFEADDVWIRGIVDAMYIKDDVMHILDWKTGKERDYADQLNMYATIMLAIHPEINKVTMEICYIDLNKKSSYGHMTRDTFENNKQAIIDLVTKIENDDIYAPKPDYLCRWCHFRKSNGGPCKW
jgi:CRISPR/Cas system-associated exonuclease Cas4 (RecB family)